jgi:tetratricopeptide (TPR) repeat protein
MQRSKVRLVKTLNRKTSILTRRRSNKPSIVWLDRNTHDKIEEEFIPKKLTDLISYKKRFYTADDCWNYLEQQDSDEKIIFIVNINCGPAFILWINNLLQVSAIYVYGTNSNKKKKWMMNPNKKVIQKTSVAKDQSEHFFQIMSVATNVRELFPEIIHHLQQKDMIANRRVIPTANDPPIQRWQATSSADINGNIIFIHTFIQILLRMTPTPTDRQDLIAICRKLFSEYDYDMQMLQEFEKHYCADTVIYWYTRDGLFYRILNEALRTQDIIVIYMLRLFIIDLYRELAALQERNIVNPINVFRAQFITKDELEKFRKSVGEHVYMNSFISTSSKKQIALRYIPSEESCDDDDSVPILFEINIDPIITAIAKLFADIHEKYWTIQFNLCEEDDHNLKDVFRDIEILMQKETNLLSIGILLYKMGKYYDAEEFYYQLLKGVDSNDVLTKALCYKGLSAVLILKGDYNSGISFLEMAISIFQYIPVDNLYIANSYRKLANCYALMHKNNSAVQYLKRALKIYTQIYGDNHIETALLYLTIAAFKTLTKYYNDALFYCFKALTFFNSHLSADHCYIGYCYYYLGVSYCRLEQYDLSLHFLEKQLKIQNNTLPADHYEIGLTYLNIGEIYEGLSFYHIALSYYTQADEIFHGTGLSSEHDAMVELQQHIPSTQNKLNTKNKLIDSMKTVLDK